VLEDNPFPISALSQDSLPLLVTIFRFCPEPILTERLLTSPFSRVGQLAKHDGLKVIGSVGSDEKLDYILKELNFDGGFNYKKEKPIDALKRLAPNGVDIYYENVGGEQLEAALDCLNTWGRIIACGMVSEYNTPEAERHGIKNLMQIVSKRLTIRGFIVGDENMGPKYRTARDENIAKWLHEGTFKVKMSVTDGIDNAPEGFVGMLQGKNFGKAVLKIADSEVSTTGSR
jgi:NADPH-dependent curcumin reductase CurA